jgi:hypothetical protein
MPLIMLDTFHIKPESVTYIGPAIEWPQAPAAEQIAPPEVLWGCQILTWCGPFNPRPAKMRESIVLLREKLLEQVIADYARTASWEFAGTWINMLDLCGVSPVMQLRSKKDPTVQAFLIRGQFRSMAEPIDLFMDPDVKAMEAMRARVVEKWSSAPRVWGA